MLEKRALFTSWKHVIPVQNIKWNKTLSNPLKIRQNKFDSVILLSFSEKCFLLWKNISWILEPNRGGRPEGKNSWKCAFPKGCIHGKSSYSWYFVVIVFLTAMKDAKEWTGFQLEVISCRGHYSGHDLSGLRPSKNNEPGFKTLFLWRRGQLCGWNTHFSYWYCKNKTSVTRSVGYF